jgi:hypothetical protein
MQKLDRLVWAVHRRYMVGEREIRLRCSSSAIADWIDSTLAAYRIEDPEPDDLYDYSLVLPKIDNSRRSVHPLTILYRGTWQILRTLNAATAAEVLLTEFESLIFDERDDAIFLDSTLVAANGSTALVTSAIIPALQAHMRYAERRGLRFAASAFVSIDPVSGRCGPVEPALHTPRDAVERFQRSFKSNGNRDRLFIDDAVSIDTVVISMPVVELMTPLSPAVAAYRLARDTLNLEAIGGRALAGLGGLVAGANNYALGTGEVRAVIDAISDAVSAS